MGRTGEQVSTRTFLQTKGLSWRGLFMGGHFLKGYCDIKSALQIRAPLTLEGQGEFKRNQTRWFFLSKGGEFFIC